jgi:hypothetical protein
MSRPIELAHPKDPRTWLRRGLEDWSKLRWPIRISVTLSFAAALVVLGWLPLLGFGNWLASAWGIDPVAPLRGQPHALGWMATFLIGIVVLIVLIYVAWCGIATALLVLVRNWSSADAYNTIFLSRYPKHWFKQ